jgi:cold shock CspA family protein
MTQKKKLRSSIKIIHHQRIYSGRKEETVFKFKKDTSKDRLLIIGNINNGLTQLSKIREKESQNLKMIFDLNQSIRLIQNDCSDCDDLQLLIYINRLIQECIQKDQQGLIPLYAEHIGFMLKQEYILKKHTTESEISNIDKTFQSKVAMVDQVNVAEKIVKEMDDITEAIVDQNISKDSPRYLLMLSDFNRLQSRLKGYRESLQMIAELMRREDMYAQVGITENTIDLVQKSMTMSVTDFMSKVEGVKVKKALFRDEGQIMDAAFAELDNDSIRSFEFDDSELQKRIEKNLLMRINKENSEQLKKIVHEFDGDALLSSIADLQKKHDELEKSIQSRFSIQKDELLKEIERVLVEVYDENYLLKQTSGDLKQTVNHFLSMKPAEIQAASLKIRSTVENWFRYHLGHDLNQMITNKNNKTVREKMSMAGVDDVVIDQLEPIYKAANPYIHNNVEQTSRKSEQERIKEIEQAVHILTEGPIRFDQVDPIEGTLRLYIKQDQGIKKFLDQQIEFSRNQDQILEYTINWVKNQNSRRQFLESKNVQLPKVLFETQQDIINYLTSNNQQASPKINEEKKETTVKNDATLNGHDTSGKLFSYNSEKGYGFISCKNDNVFFHVTDLNGISTDQLQGKIELVFQLAEGPKGKIAKNVRLKNS